MNRTMSIPHLLLALAVLSSPSCQASSSYLRQHALKNAVNLARDSLGSATPIFGHSNRLLKMSEDRYLLPRSEYPRAERFDDHSIKPLEEHIGYIRYSKISARLTNTVIVDRIEGNITEVRPIDLTDEQLSAIEDGTYVILPNRIIPDDLIYTPPYGRGSFICLGSLVDEVRENAEAVCTELDTVFTPTAQESCWESFHDKSKAEKMLDRIREIVE